MKNLYTENCETLIRETEDTKKQIRHADGLEALILLKCPCYPEQSTDSMLSQPKFKAFFFTEVNK